MNKTGLKKVLKGVKRDVGKYSPQILIGFGIAGMVTTTVLAVKATPKALQLIEEAKYEKQEKVPGESRELTPIEVVKVAYKPYIPAMITGTLSVACLISSSKVSTRRTAAIATAYKLSETALSEYKDAVIETIGEKKEKQIKEKVNAKKLENNQIDQSKVIFTGNGDQLCYDAISGRYFKSNIEKIKKVENELNFALRNDDYISLNYLYDRLGLESITIGDDLGWNIDRDGYIEFDLGAQIARDEANPGLEGVPCIVLDYNVPPKYDYYKTNY